MGPVLHEDGNLLRTITFLRNRETERKKREMRFLEERREEEESSMASLSDLLPALYAFLSVWHRRLFD